MSQKPPNRIACRDCPLRKRMCFSQFTGDEIAFMESFKSGELDMDPGSPLVMEGSASPHLFTVLSGMAKRYKTLADGRRQVIGFVFPGDFVGLQSAVMDEMQHTVEAVTKVRLCVFNRADYWRLFHEQPARGYDVSWLAAREEYFLGDHLLSVGRRGAEERIAFALWALHRRASDVGIAAGDAMDMPFTQQDVADALGLSLVHTNKTLRKLRTKGVVEWASRRLTILDAAALVKVAGVEEPPPRLRPLL